ncbi:MAG: VWA domain-containing protein [Ardenticatenia bacterium]|nr:VWA domain-containing protein [Ardenticatenia bacterium]
MRQPLTTLLSASEVSIAAGARLRPVRALILLLAPLLAAFGAPAPGPYLAPPAALAERAQQSDTYRLVDTWQNRPAQPNPDALSAVALDQVGTADGMVWVLTWGYLEAYGADGHKQKRFRLENYGGWMRVDATPDGDLWVLSRLGSTSVLTRYRPDGTVAAKSAQRFEDKTEVSFDVAATADGGAVLTRSSEFRTLPSSLDFFDAKGQPVRRLLLTETIVPDAPYIVPMNVDIDALGRIHLTYIMDGCCQVPPPGNRTPTPTRPSMAAEAATPTAGRPAARAGRPSSIQGSVSRLEIKPPPTGAGIMLLAKDDRLLKTVYAFYLHDIVTGAAGTFVANAYRLWEVDYTDGRIAEAQPDADFRRSKRIGYGLSWPRDHWWDSHLALRSDGRLFMTSGSCFLSGVLALGPKVTAYQPARPLARQEPPLLEGPPYPVALAGHDGLQILQGPFRRDAAKRPMVAASSDLTAIQRWDLSGTPRDLMTLCGTEGEVTTDVAADGDHVYHISPHLVWSRPDGVLPEWGLVDDDAYFVAAAADDGRVAVLDARKRRILVVSAGSGATQAVDLADFGLDERVVADDLALAGQNILLADIGRDRILTLDPALKTRVEFPTHDGPKAVAAGPGGEIFVLGRGGWGLRYGPTGDLRAVWSMPKRLGVEATDIAVADDGRVYVSFVGINSSPDPQGYQLINQAGVWVFEAAAPEEGAPPRRPSGICLVDRDKTAAPPRVPLGATVDVILTVSGACPRRMAPHQVVFVLDTSGSMEWDRSLDRAKEALISLLAAMDPWVGEAGLITFNDGASLDGPLSHDLAAMRAMVAGVKPLGDTRYGAAIELARLELTGARGDAAAQRTIVVVTDGGVKDDPTEAIAAARAAGIGFLVLAYPNNNFKPDGVEKLLRPFFGAGTEFLYDIGVGRIEQAAEKLRTWILTPGLFTELTVRDEVPANMELLPESIQPPAAEVLGRTITWRLRDVPAAVGVTLRYRLRPLEAGEHPTNVQADADYVDAIGNAARFRFPVPRVEVFVPTATPTPTVTPTPRPRAIYLPLLLREAPVKRDQPIDIILVLDTSSSMAGEKLDAAKAGVWFFLDGVNLRTARVALVGFDGAARGYLPLTSDELRLKVTVAGLVTGRGTRIDLGLAMARDILAARAERGRDSAVILLTDGRHTGAPEDAAAAALSLRQLGTRLVFIGLGADLDQAALERWAGDPAAVHLAPEPGDLTALYGRLARQIGCLDGDYWGRRCGG